MTLQDAVDKLLKEHKRAEENAQFALSILGCLDEVAAEWAIYREYIAVYITPDLKAFKRVRRLLGREWFQWNSHSDDHGNHFISFVHKLTNRQLTIIRDADLAAETCQRVKIGTKVVDVYKVECE